MREVERIRAEGAFVDPVPPTQHRAGPRPEQMEVCKELRIEGELAFARVEVLVPEEFMGDIMGDMNSRRGRVLGMDLRPGFAPWASALFQ